MPSRNIFILHGYLKKYFLLFYGFATVGVLSLFSCGQQSSDQSATAKNFAKVLDTTRYIYDKHPAQAMHYLDSVIARNKDVGVANKFEFYRLHCFYSYRAKPGYNKAMLYADSMLDVIKSSGNEKNLTKQLGIAYFSKGDIYFAADNFPQAYQYYYRGKVVGKNSLDSCTLSDYSYRMGMITYKQENFRLAANYFKQSYEENIACNMNFVTFYRMQELLDNAAISYHKAGITDSAGIFYNKALDYINSEAHKYPNKQELIEVARAVVYGNQAKLFQAKGDYVKAEEMLEKSIAINLKKGNDNSDAELSELKLADIYADLNDNTRLLALLQNIRLQFDSVKNGEAQVEWNHLMADYYQKHGKFKEALQYFNNYDRLKDSVDQTTQTIKNNDVNHQFKDFEDQSIIVSLKSDNKIQRDYLIVAVVYGSMALVIILLVFLNWRRSKRNVKALSELNAKINEQKDSLQQAINNLEVTDNEKDRILRAVAHDLRNPIGGIASLTAIMLMEDMDSEQKELLELIQNTTNNSLELINEILEATGAKSGSAIKKQMVDINTLLSNSVELLRFKAAEKNQQIILEMLETPLELFISREKIWRVVSNLISNAIKFSPQGAVINVKVIEEANDVCIAVSDHGIGIPDDIKGLVFNMFTQAKRLGTAGEPSFGLGLSISKQIIDSHGGEIWFDSAPAYGTTFYVRLKKAEV